MKKAEEHIRIATERDVTRAILNAGAIASAAGFDTAGRAMVSTAVSELTRNILKYAGRGTIALRVVQGPRGTGIEVVAEDEGPGIADPEEALREHFSTGGTLGLGLPGVKRIADLFDITSRPGAGTRVAFRKWV